MLVAPLPDPHASSGSWGICPQAPETGSTTFMRGRLGAADYAPGLLGAETFRCIGKKNFFQKKVNFSEKKVFFLKTFFFL